MKRRSAWMGRDGPENSRKFQAWLSPEGTFDLKNGQIVKICRQQRPFGPPKFLCYNAGAMQ
jgi:hypothetical protein